MKSISCVFLLILDACSLVIVKFFASLFIFVYFFCKLRNFHISFNRYTLIFFNRRVRWLQYRTPTNTLNNAVFSNQKVVLKRFLKGKKYAAFLKHFWKLFLYFYWEKKRSFLWRNVIGLFGILHWMCKFYVTYETVHNFCFNFQEFNLMLLMLFIYIRPFRLFNINRK